VWNIKRECLCGVKIDPNNTLFLCPFWLMDHPPRRSSRSSRSEGEKNDLPDRPVSLSKWLGRSVWAQKWQGFWPTQTNLPWHFDRPRAGATMVSMGCVTPMTNVTFKYHHEIYMVDTTTNNLHAINFSEITHQYIQSYGQPRATQNSHTFNRIDDRVNFEIHLWKIFTTMN
jgi:hypothetical protein